MGNMVPAYGDAEWGKDHLWGHTLVGTAVVGSVVSLGAVLSLFFEVEGILHLKKILKTGWKKKWDENPSGIGFNKLNERGMVSKGLKKSISITAGEKNTAHFAFCISGLKVEKHE